MPLVEPNDDETQAPHRGAIAHAPEIWPFAGPSPPSPPSGLFLDPKYTFHDPQFFVRGRVFMTAWYEPAGEVGPDDPWVLPSRFLDQQVYCKPRTRFVVVRSGANRQSCIALQIGTFKFRGSKKSVDMKELGMIYAAHTPDYVGLPPRRHQAGMRPTAIPVIPVAGQGLHPMSMIRYGEPQTLQLNQRFAEVGMVHPDYLGALLQQYSDVFARRY